MTRKEQSLKRFHTFKINEYAKKIIIIRNINTLIKIWKTCKKKEISFLILGEGSNTLFSKYYNGIVAINKIKGIKITETRKNWLIYAKGGVKWHNLVTHTLNVGIYGLENLAFIPGTVGAAPIQNIGAYGLEFKDICDYIEIFSLTYRNVIKIKNKYCMFKYRDSIFKNANYYNYIILAVGIKLPKKWIPNVSYLSLQNLDRNNLTAYTIFNHIKRIRNEKFPNLNIIGHAGSFFKNPIINKNCAKKLLFKYKNLPNYPESNNNIKISAGWLIEQCQLKGYSIGGAQVCQNQALVLINKYKATAKDVLTLANIVQNKVKQKFNIFLELEIKIIENNNIN
ncbi:MAG: UDP-N-acetylmuramate dehydrogenase [Buchnera aphidicola (Floraphis choui)]